MNRFVAGNFLAVLAAAALVGPAFGAETGGSTNAVVSLAGSAATTNAVSEQETARRKHVHDAILHLYQIQMNSDAASLAAIMAETTNAEPQIRKAAVNAAVQFGDRAVIPELQKLADATQDPFEKVDILKAIEYMKLPSLTEYTAYRQSLKTNQPQTNAVTAATNAPVAATNAPVAATNPPAAVHP
jgi:hypothetical protein